MPCFASFCRSKRKAPAASGANYAFAKGSTPPIGDHKLSPAGQAHSLGLCKRPRPAGRRNENMPRQKDRKKLLPQRDRSFICGGKWGASDGSLYFAGTQAAGAGVDTAGSTVYNCLYSSDIGLPGTVRTAMGVRNLDTERDTLATARTFGHNCLHLLFNSFNSIAYTARKCKCFDRKNFDFFHNFAFLFDSGAKYCVFGASRACLAAVSTI